MEILLGALGITLVAGFFYYENNGISTTNYEVDCGIGKDIKSLEKIMKNLKG